MNNEICPFGAHLEKYWKIRYDLFSRFDSGIQIDVQGLYSAKPETISYEIGGLINGDTILDAFGGVGASAIGFARNGKNVICVEIDEKRVNMIQNNIEIYGLTEKIKVIKGNVLDLQDKLEYDSVYLDPPWGGPSYIDKQFFSLENFEPNGKELLTSFKKAKQTVLTIPLNFDFNELSNLGKDYLLKWGILHNKRIFANVFLENKSSWDADLF
jgi:trimethylguanosine synthase